MSKRYAGLVLVAGSVFAGGAVSWAQESPGAGTGTNASPANAEAAKACKEQIRSSRAAGEKPTAEQRQALKACLQQAGVDPQRLKARLQQRKDRRPFDGYLGHAVHGDLVVRERDGDFENVTLDRGKVADTTTTTRIVLDRPDGKQVSFDLTEATRYKGIEGAGDIHKGEPATVFSKDGKAVVVGQRQREQ